MAEAVLGLADKTLAMFPSSFEEDKTENWIMETTRCAQGWGWSRGHNGDHYLVTSSVRDNNLPQVRCRDKKMNGSDQTLALRSIYNKRW